MPDEDLMEDALQVIVKSKKIRAWLKQNDPKALEQVKAALVSEDPHFGVVRWLPGDVLSKTEDLDMSLTEEDAKRWLADNQKHIADRLVERGFDAIETLLSEDKTVQCKFCKLYTHLRFAHRHDNGHVCGVCWDERLRTTE